MCWDFVSLILFSEDWIFLGNSTQHFTWRPCIQGRTQYGWESQFPQTRNLSLKSQVTLFRSVRTSYRTFDSRPSTCPATIFLEFIDELKHCRQASRTPQTIYFLKAHDVSYPNADENTNTKTNASTSNTNIRTTNRQTDICYMILERRWK